MQSTITIHVHGPAATAISFVAEPDPVHAPVAPGTVFGHIEIIPLGWVGDIGVSGADAVLIGIDGHMQLVAIATLTEARDYQITVTAAE